MKKNTVKNQVIKTNRTVSPFDHYAYIATNIGECDVIIDELPLATGEKIDLSNLSPAAKYNNSINITFGTNSSDKRLHLQLLIHS